MEPKVKIKHEVIDEIDSKSDKKRKGRATGSEEPKQKVIKSEKSDILTDLNAQISKFVQSMQDNSNGDKIQNEADTKAKFDKKVDTEKQVASKIVALKSYGASGMTIWKCTVCDRESADKNRLQAHIENAHVL